MAPPNHYNSNIKDHWSQIAIPNTIIVKGLEVLWDLPKCDTNAVTNAKVSQCCWKNGTDRLAWGRAATDLQVVKHAVPAQRSKVKLSKTRCACGVCLCLLLFRAAIGNLFHRMARKLITKIRRHAKKCYIFCLSDKKIGIVLIHSHWMAIVVSWLLWAFYFTT